MLFLVFEIDNERYCLEVSRIIEITPIVIFRELPHAPAYISGVFNYRGVVVPVVDLSMLIAGRPSRPLLIPVSYWLIMLGGTIYIIQ